MGFRTGGVLALWCVLAGCGSRSLGNESTEQTTGVPAPIALPPLSLPSAPAPTNTATSCEFGAPFALLSGGTRVLGVWRDPTNNAVVVARATQPNVVALATLAPETGALTELRTITLPEHADAQAAWRAVGGDPLISWRSGRSLHLSRAPVAGPTEVMLYRYDSGYGSESRDQVLEPLDDPSASSLVGVVLGATLPGSSNMLCVSNTNTFSYDRCQYNWTGVLARRTGYARPAGSALVAVFRSYSTAPSEVLFSQQSYQWQTLGRAPAGAPSAPRYGGYGARGNRTARADAAHGGPMVAMAPSGGVVLWVEDGGTLVAQATNGDGVPNADPVGMPFVDPYLDDAAATPGEVLVTLSTRADRNDRQGTSSLLRLHPSVLASAPVVATPQRIPLANARILLLNDQRILFWSPRSARALLASCGPSVR